MTYLLQGMFGERSLTKIAGLFSTNKFANDVAEEIQHLPGIQNSQVRILSPADATLARNDMLGIKLSPEQSGIFFTLIRTHLVLGFMGGISGLLLFWILMNSGSPMIESSKMLALIAFVGFGITFGLLAGGLVSLRPDHILLLNHVRSALQKGSWVVVVHPTDSSQTKSAQAIFKRYTTEILKTF